MCYFSHGSHCVEIGIKICVLNLQNHGLGKQALKLLISYLFSKGYKRIILSTDLSNKRAHMFMKHSGFKFMIFNMTIGKIHKDRCIQPSFMNSFHPHSFLQKSCNDI